MENSVGDPMVIPLDDADAEQALIEQAQRHPPLFGVLYERYVLSVYRYLRTRAQTEEDARDMTQQVFLNAFDALPNYRARGVPFKAWLFQIASHLATDSYRRRKIQVTWDRLPEAMHARSEQEPETCVLRNEDQARLYTALSRLSTANRELLALRFAARLSSTEIALVVGKKPAAVKKQLTRLLHTLKEAFYEV